MQIFAISYGWKFYDCAERVAYSDTFFGDAFNDIHGAQIIGYFSPRHYRLFVLFSPYRVFAILKCANLLYNFTHSVPRKSRICDWHWLKSLRDSAVHFFSVEKFTDNRPEIKLSLMRSPACNYNSVIEYYFFCILLTRLASRFFSSQRYLRFYQRFNVSMITVFHCVICISGSAYYWIVVYLRGRSHKHTYARIKR